MIWTKTAVVIWMTIISVSAFGQSIIPQPNIVNHKEGVFRFSGELSVSSRDKIFQKLIPGFILSAQKFAELSIVEKKKAAIRLVRNSEIKGSEEYQLTIDEKKITIEASTENGCFYGLQSLLQLLVFSDNTHEIKCVQITDEPRLGWRGFMLDESRHFFGTNEVKKLLDQMALLKLNKFHWHLTDEPGWRIEIKSYPLLTQIGGVGNYSDPDAPAQFYTQNEIKEIVAYAAERFIEIIPEIDMPGHATAAVKAYPEYSGGGSEKHPDFTFNPGNPETYTFLTNILREVTTLFPSEYIHIGGDEVSYGNQQWPELPGVKKLMKENELSNLNEVEHHFILQMADSVSALGKKLIGWDELVSSGVNNRETLVMWWRHDKPGVLQQALEKDFKVVLCPRIPLYFDFVQDENHKSGRKWGGKFAPVKSVYDFPSSAFLPASAIANTNVMGIQANLWTETIASQSRLEFMIFPRICALAEAAWTIDRAKDYNNFETRLKMMFPLYRNENIEYFDHISGEGKEIQQSK
ncbi:MAG: beta-N-acetylhexosaminidase [Draconibacterium sp.]